MIHLVRVLMIDNKIACCSEVCDDDCPNSLACVEVELDVDLEEDFECDKLN